MTYSINLHAHTFFSDGANSPLAMAMEANNLGHSALVITDHYYYGTSDRWTSLNEDRYNLLRVACKEAKNIIPVIIGVELAFGGEEMLTFGSAMIQKIMAHDSIGKDLTVDLILEWKKEYDSVFILCHPGNPENWARLTPILDGYEEYNSGQNWFGDDRDRGALEGLVRWCNSDAHSASGLQRAWNFVDAKIENESELIRYIKRGKQPERYLLSRDDLRQRVIYQDSIFA